MSTKVFDDDAQDAVRSGKTAPTQEQVAVSSLADALRRNEIRKRKLAIRSYLSIIALGLVASMSIYVAQVVQVRQLNERGYHACITRNQQFLAERSLIEAIAETASTSDIRDAAQRTLDTVPAVVDCAAVWGFDEGDR